VGRYIVHLIIIIKTLILKLVWGQSIPVKVKNRKDGKCTNIILKKTTKLHFVNVNVIWAFGVQFVVLVNKNAIVHNL